LPNVGKFPHSRFVRVRGYKRPPIISAGSEKRTSGVGEFLPSYAVVVAPKGLLEEWLRRSKSTLRPYALAAFRIALGLVLSVGRRKMYAHSTILLWRVVRKKRYRGLLSFFHLWSKWS